MRRGHRVSFHVLDAGHGHGRVRPRGQAGCRENHSAHFGDVLFKANAGDRAGRQLVIAGRSGGNRVQFFVEPDADFNRAAGFLQRSDARDLRRERIRHDRQLGGDAIRRKADDRHDAPELRIIVSRGQFPRCVTGARRAGDVGKA